MVSGYAEVVSFLLESGDDAEDAGGCDVGVRCARDIKKFFHDCFDEA